MQQRGARNALAATAPIEGRVGASPELNGGYGAIVLATVVARLMPDAVGVHFEWLSATQTCLSRFSKPASQINPDSANWMRRSGHRRLHPPGHKRALEICPDSSHPSRFSRP